MFFSEPTASCRSSNLPKEAGPNIPVITSLWTSMESSSEFVRESYSNRYRRLERARSCSCLHDNYISRFRRATLENLRGRHSTGWRWDDHGAHTMLRPTAN